MPDESAATDALALQQASEQAAETEAAANLQLRKEAVYTAMGPIAAGQIRPSLEPAWADKQAARAILSAEDFVTEKDVANTLMKYWAPEDLRDTVIVVRALMERLGMMLNAEAPRICSIYARWLASFEIVRLCNYLRAGLNVVDSFRRADPGRPSSRNAIREDDVCVRSWQLAAAAGVPRDRQLAKVRQQRAECRERDRGKAPDWLRERHRLAFGPDGPQETCAVVQRGKGATDSPRPRASRSCRRDSCRHSSCWRINQKPGKVFGSRRCVADPLLKPCKLPACLAKPGLHASCDPRHV